ncbi:inositol monophosphatase family protein [Streptomyces sp. NPDC059010]|uniref:inositol monophosphatase family protein n=1 Tax=Streptomyces sp. NPDC059010 TaxID=3346695 RepID=UPI0036AB9DC5
MDLSWIDAELGRALHRFRSAALEPVKVTRSGPNVQTDLDQRTDELLRRALKSIADVPIMSEERPEEYFGRSGHCWIVDPIDGTLNAVAGTDDFAISVSLVDAANLKSLAGAVYLPRTGVLYKAVQRRGAFRNDRILAVQGDEWQRVRESQRIVSFGVPKNGSAVARRMSDALFELYSGGWITRQTGAASIDICRVAGGAWSAFFEYGLMYWDFAAASLVAEEAGCSVCAIPSTSYGADQVPLEYDLIVARTPEILEEIAAAVGLSRTHAVGRE